jgi:hypothetical protein
MSNRFLVPLTLGQQATPSSPASGSNKLYFKSDGLPYRLDSSGGERLVGTGTVLAFSLGGALTVQSGAHRIYNDTGATLTIRSVRASVGTAPTGAAILVDVNIGGTTIFTTQGNRPSIAVSTNTAKVTNMSVTTIADGGYFTVDVDQIGSTVAGSDLTVQILCG